MSKRSVPDDKPAGLPVPKKSRLDIDTGIAEVKSRSAELLKALKNQNNQVQVGHYVSRGDTQDSLTQAETLVATVAKLETTATNTVDELIVNVIDAEIHRWFKVFEQESNRFADGESCGPLLFSYIYHCEMEERSAIRDVVKKQVQDVPLCNPSSKIRKETKVAFKKIMSKEMMRLLEETML
ncbi:hypothetical protein D6D28_07243 [Aureobasidium pullulans]|uniref:Uncharacterized protein n=1 Tax=Aureobasidium pullulans TaxID=5580 RepID=A0A4S8SBI4_AURPU|nr:hypothetical protein D6D28_07243 [Aureobasidium pullulans]